LVERLDTLAASKTDLETRFDLLRRDVATQRATFSETLEHLQKELLETRFDLLRRNVATQRATFSDVLEHLQTKPGGEEFLATDSDLQACIQTTSSHVARLERLHEKWTAMQAVGSSTEQLQEVVRDAVQHGAQNLHPSQELGALPQSSERSTRTSPPGSVSLHTLVSNEDVGHISQTSGKDGCCVGSSGDSFAHKPGLVNSRIQHFEGRIQGVMGRSTLPDGMQQIVSLDAHLQPQAEPSPCGETQTTTVTSTSHVAATSLPLPSHAPPTEQRLSSHGREAAGSCGGSSYASMRIPVDSSEVSAFILASLDQDSLNVKLDVSSKTQSREEPQLCLT